MKSLLSVAVCALASPKSRTRLCALSCLSSFIATAGVFGQSSFIVRPVALNGTTGTFGPQLDPGTSFTGFNGYPSVDIAGGVAYPGDVLPVVNGVGEGFWLSQGGQNTAIAVTNDDGLLGPGLGNGVVLNNTFHDPLTGAPGDVLIGGFLAGSGVNSNNDLVYVEHRAGFNVPLARTGVANSLGPGMGDDIVFSSLNGAEMNTSSEVVLNAAIAGPDVTPATTQGVWRNTPTGNVALARSGLDGILGPGLGNGVTFDNNGNSSSAFQQFQLLDGSGDLVFIGKTINSSTSAKGIGLWKNSGVGNVPFALSGVTGSLGPGLGTNLTFADPQQIGFASTQFYANTHGATAFFSTLSDGRRGLWRNLGQQNEPLMLVGETGTLGPGVGIQDTFANFTTSILLADPTINESNVVLFPGVLANSHEQGLWLHSESGNKAIALTGSDSQLGPGLGPGVTFTGFNRAYFGSDDTVFFTANLSFNVPSNRNLGLWAYRDGKVEPIVVYNELFDVDPTAATDLRRVNWVQIPSDFTFDGDYGANEFNQLVFRMGFQDGSQGIFMATQIPETNTVYLFGVVAVAAVFLNGRRTKHSGRTV